LPGESQLRVSVSIIKNREAQMAVSMTDIQDNIDLVREDWKKMNRSLETLHTSHKHTTRDFGCSLILKEDVLGDFPRTLARSLLTGHLDFDSKKGREHLDAMVGKLHAMRTVLDGWTDYKYLNYSFDFGGKSQIANFAFYYTYKVDHRGRNVLQLVWIKCIHDWTEKKNWRLNEDWWRVRENEAAAWLKYETLQVVKTNFTEKKWKELFFDY